MEKKNDTVLALFYCKNIPDSSESVRQDLEDKYRGNVRFFPLPCSGRLDSLHLLKALEEYADAAYILTCPENTCRYFEGNSRAVKRVKKAQEILDIIGLEKERAGIVINNSSDIKTLTVLTEEIKKRADILGPSPVHDRSNQKMKKAS